jgi:hypothetical protein
MRGLDYQMAEASRLRVDDDVGELPERTVGARDLGLELDSRHLAR